MALKAEYKSQTANKASYNQFITLNQFKHMSPKFFCIVISTSL